MKTVMGKGDHDKELRQSLLMGSEDADLSYSVMMGSQDAYEHFCQPCNVDDIHVEAEFYCSNCEEYMCRKCSMCHKKFKQLSDHDILDLQQMNHKPPLVSKTKINTETSALTNPEPVRFCRVTMPDGSTTVVGTKKGQTINYVLGKLLEKRSIAIVTVDVFLLGSEKPLNLNDDITTLGSKEVRIERRVLFRMELPNKKSIGVKAKPNRQIRDVFRPILHKYGYRVEDIHVHLYGPPEVQLHLDSLVSTIDSQRVVVLT